MLGCTSYEAEGGAWLLAIRDVTELLSQRKQAHRETQTSVVGQMAMGFAHEVRNMLAAVVTLLASLEQEFEPGDHRLDYLSRLRRLAGKLAHLTTSTLRFGRAPAPIQRTMLMRQSVESAIENMAVRLQGATIACIEEPPGLTAVADQAQVAQVFEILLENALDVVSPDHIRVRLRQAGDAVECLVEDDGPGIPSEQLGQILAPFFTTKPTGTGLGLAIAARILVMHQTSLSVHSVPGRGATFSFLLPRAATPERS